MGIRLTGISTPFGGVSWEYPKPTDRLEFQSMYPERKIKVFISSICGVEKYDKVRGELKKAIEATQLAEVYTFEGEEASTLPAGDHYILALEDSDICIFLIDNADKITPGVQKEIDTVNRCNIKALYYFCDETQKEKTALEQSLMGARFAKSKTVHSFEELSQKGVYALVEDIVTVYHYYCIGKIVLNSSTVDEVQREDVVGTEKYQLPTIPKSTLKDVDKCKNFILKFVLGSSHKTISDNKTSEFDEWGVQFLQVLFEKKTIKQFNVAMYLEELKNQQDGSHFQVVQIRWQAIQAYFSGDIEKCVDYLESALKVAKELKESSWVIKDILIDLRNQHWTQCMVRNEFSDTPAQAELTESDEELYYPILDRLHDSLHGKYIEGLYKQKTDSPYSITIGSNLEEYGEMLASSLIVAMYNGSLTHILLVYEEVRDFVFYLCCKYDDWNLRLNLYKLAIFAGKEKEIKGIQNSYPEVLNKMTAEDALSIIEFCFNHPIYHERFNSQLLAFGAIGYFLSDESFKYYEKIIVTEITTWLNDEKHVVLVGQNIFRCFSGVAYRMSQDTLSNVCCQFIDMHYSRWYTDLFKFIAKYIDLRKMSDDSKKNFIAHINDIFEREQEREQINYAPAFLHVLRNQDPLLTDEIDNKVATYFPKYYEDIYRLETTENEEQDMPIFVRGYVERIKENNDRQGKAGVYFGSGKREIATLRNVLLEEDLVYDSEIMDAVITTVSETLVSKESISTKLDAIALLICICIKYPADYARNIDAYEKIFAQMEVIENADYSVILSNIDTVSLKIGLQLLRASMNIDVYADILELMPLIHDDVATTIAVTNIIVEYLEIADDVLLPIRVEGIVLQNVLRWLHSEYIDVRWNATKILIALSRRPENRSIVNHQLTELIDTDGVYIKNLIIRNMKKVQGLSKKTKDYIISKCSQDANYAVRMVCMKEEQLSE